eukprot:TRINITY_DN1548_c0_g1_i3.p1 TRINITY_DN1548_c0_g1~~TRINITY_DN1548_c0_g1_i3.p1  ORF type:complete len:105 (-),score=6.21 TRINITY_DN1548_c0_g1_i3:239-553(-)
MKSMQWSRAYRSPSSRVTSRFSCRVPWCEAGVGGVRCWRAVLWSCAAHLVDFVANEHFDGVRVGGVQLDLVKPLVQVGERLAFAHVVHKADAVCTSVVCVFLMT